MKKFLGVFVLFFVSIAAFAQTGAQIEFEAEKNTIDYGVVVKGEDDGLRTFVFTNTGDEPLVITRVNSSCGCTVPKKPEEPIMPGEKGEIQVKYNMRLGKINRAITVESNATNVNNGRAIVRIKGEVVQSKS